MLSRAEAIAMGELSGDELLPLMEQARDVRQRAWGTTVTYSRKVFIPLTNLCRDQCGYCTFARQPGEAGAGYLTPAQVMAIAARGEALGCKEALFSLGEKPELRYPEARAALDALGYASTMDYVVAMAGRVLTETSLIPHVNAGTLTRDELVRLKSVCGSVGLMLENVSRRLVQRGMAHYACPDKVPVQRLRTLEMAGIARIATTTGILIGIGETWAERIDSLLAIAELHARHGHLQEVIVQNFRAKPGTPMATWQEPGHDDMLRTLAVARLMLPADISLQAPPNLAEAFEDYLDAGINDWGGISPVTADHINPERAWPAIHDVARRSRGRGLTLAERLTTYPRYLRERAFLAPAPRRALASLARADGLALQQYEATPVATHEECAA
ncbi:7,8-didemethyl-8-hydroxy-5-deazariboflavin synthase CofG [Paraburkholderia antibiotica]|uniref:7,8-didemethyl-8-hydroxy-5-deazariboflavin synthase n=1 Tax=Paraburkholderia antibiotica TaxID=2728839 RepID=A0A7X9X6E0_9BURK|nr:7,8-didemethyl-8-hydroxy-5-deazariboflavin synthase CofG [Paraburkholderia antibiotica]NML32354.1 7,8-didemethyl-8-hydroxy-5-deazariboflavin synthase CofG [Paraburkholderia antibiotica]